MPLFEVAVIERPTKKDAEEGAHERLVMPPKPVIATDEQSAAVIAIMNAVNDIKVDKKRMEVLVRPFG